MEPALENPYGSFRAPRVPLDLRCIGMGAAGWGVLQLADGWMARIFETDRPIAQLMGPLQAEPDSQLAFLARLLEPGHVVGNRDLIRITSQDFPVM